MAVAFVNKPFTENVREQAFALIHAGESFVGGIWRNRTSTASKMKYGTWEGVPEDVRACVNQIGRAASKRGKEHIKQKRAVVIAQQKMLPVRTKPVGFVLTKEVLGEIHYGSLKVPTTATTEQIREIREYITVQSGFNPASILLGIASHMDE